MNPVFIAWALCLLATLSFLPVGIIRLLAGKRGAADYGRDMMALGWGILALGVVAGLAFIALSIVMLIRA